MKTKLKSFDPLETSCSGTFCSRACNPRVRHCAVAAAGE